MAKGLKIVTQPPGDPILQVQSSSPATLWSLLLNLGLKSTFRLSRLMEFCLELFVGDFL